THPCALGFADGRARQPVSRQPRRWPCGNEPKQFLDSAGTLFFPALQHSGNRHLWRAQPVPKHAAIWPFALRDHRRDVGVPFHLHLLDDSQESDRPERPRHLLLARRHLFDEPVAAQRDGHSWISANYICSLRRGFADKSQQLLPVDCRSFSGLCAQSVIFDRADALRSRRKIRKLYSSSFALPKIRNRPKWKDRHCVG